MDNYDFNYIKWQKWNEYTFGNLSKDKYFYFKKVIEKIKISNDQIPSKILEIGFGNGEFLNFARKQTWEIDGIEINEILLNKAIKEGYNSYKSIKEVLETKKKYDLVFAFDVLEHLDDIEIDKLFLSLKKLLNDNGSFVARFPNGDSPFSLPIQNGDATHLTSIGSGKILYLVSKYKLEPIYIGNDITPIFNTSLLKILQRIISLPIKFLINLVVNIIFFPGDMLRINFTSKNLLIVLKNSV